MDGYQRTARAIFAVCLVGLGALGLVYGDFAMQWQPVPSGIPGYTGLAYTCAALEILLGVGLLVPAAASAAARVLVVYAALWWVLLKVPAIVRAPHVEASWLALGEIGVILAGAWMLALWTARPAPPAAHAQRATLLFGLALVPIGLSHLFYTPQTAALVPSYLPFPRAWAYATGLAQVAAGLGVLFSVMPSLAATLEASALSIFTILVWLPGLFRPGAGRLQWTALTMSSMIAAGAWVAAAGIAARHETKRAETGP